MSTDNNRRDLFIHHYHSTPEDDKKAGIKRCASCGTPIVVRGNCIRRAV